MGMDMFLSNAELIQILRSASALPSPRNGDFDAAAARALLSRDTRTGAQGTARLPNGDHRTFIEVGAFRRSVATNAWHASHLLAVDERHLAKVRCSGLKYIVPAESEVAQGLEGMLCFNSSTVRVKFRLDEKAK